MDLISMKLFVSIAGTQNITRTAQEFFMTQPVVSRRMQELENQLGFKLFTRHRHGVILTEEGEELAPVFEEALRLIDQEVSRIKSRIQVQPRTVSIAAITPATNIFLPSIIGEFSSRYPDIRVDVQRMVPSRIMEELRSGTYDIYISCGPDLPISGEWDSCPVRSDPFGLIVRDSEPVSSPEEAVSLLRKSRMYLIPMEDSPATTRESLNILALLGMEHIPKTELRPIESIMFNIASGMGVAILPDKIAPLDAFGLKCVPLGIERSMCMSTVWRKDAPEEVQAFAELLKARL